MRTIYTRLCLATVNVTLLATLAACGSSDDYAGMVDPPGSLQPVSSSENVLNDDASLQCDAGTFDEAELLFTESDRQWFCSVASSDLASTDEVYFSRNGTASFARFGEVYWNRNLPGSEINVASPFVSSFVIKEINSANTTLQFLISTDTEIDQQYDCVLVQRTGLS